MFDRRAQLTARAWWAWRRGKRSLASTSGDVGDTSRGDEAELESGRLKLRRFPNAFVCMDRVSVATADWVLRFTQRLKEFGMNPTSAGLPSTK